MDMSPAGTGRMVVALGLIGLLAISAWFTMEPGKYRSLTLILLAFFWVSRSAWQATFAVG